MRKHLRNHREVAHFWANQTQEEGRSGNMFFVNETIYSYGHHFPIARYVTTPGGERVCLCNAARYSPSTGTHQGITRHAIPSDIQVFTVPFVHSSWGYRTSYDDTVDQPSVIEYYRQHCIAAYESAARARARFDWKYSDAQRLHEQFRAYVWVFDLADDAQPALAEVDELAWQFDSEKPEGIRARLREAAGEAARKKREAMKEKIEQWRQGQGARIYGLHPQLLRVRVIDQCECVETSDSAWVTEREAIIAYKRWKRHELRHGDSIGHYTVLSVNGTIKVGCHEFDTEEINALAVAREW